MTRKPDIVIIGGGVVGASIAYHAARKGAAVTLVDARTLASAPSASWASAGGLRSQGRCVAEQPISIRASQRWKTLSEELDAELECAFGGHLHVAETEAEEAVVEARLAADLAGGVAIERVSRAALRGIAPDLAPHIRMGAWTPGDGQANPALVTRAFAAAAQRLGARILENVVASPVIEQGRLAGVRLPDGSILAGGTTVLSVGAWGVSWLAQLGLDLPIRWRGLQMQLSDPSSISLLPTITAVGRNLSLKQSPSGGLMIGGRWFARPTGDDLQVGPIPGHIDAQWAGARAILPELANRKMHHMWAGAEAQTIDSMPFIGPSGIDGLYLSLGFSNHGFQTSPVMGELIAEDILVSRQAELAAFSPARSGVRDEEWLRFEQSPISLLP